MVKFTDGRGRGYEVSVWDSLLPSPSRPAVRRIQRNERKNSLASGSPSEPDDAKESKSKEKESKKSSSPVKKSSTRIKLPRPNAALGDWTEEHDIQLLKLKDEDEKKWLNIVMLMGKPKTLLTERYNEVKKRLYAGSGATSGSSEDSGSQSSTRARGSWEEVVDPVGSDEDTWSATDPLDFVMEPEPQTPVLEVGDKALTLSEMRHAVRLNDYLEEQKWLFLASKLFDKTGKRFTPEALKQGLSGD